MRYFNHKILLSLFSVSLWLTACNKLTQVPEPINTVTTTEAFSSDATATSAIIGIYNDFLNGPFANSLHTLSLGMSADELHQFGGPSNFENNIYTPTSNDVNPFWNSAYYDIYLANAAIETLPASTGVSEGVKTELMGEAKFFRAFFHFYLVNLFGNVPIVTTTAYRNTDTLHRAPVSEVYNQIITDLLDAENLLPADYSVSGGQKTRVNQMGAMALLARVYLYTQQWNKAEAQASSLIASNTFKLTDLNNVFLSGSDETIFQLQTPDKYPYATTEGNILIPYDSTANPNYYLTDALLSSFEDSDQRRVDWVDSTDFSGAFYYVPFKYKVFVGTQGNVQENYVVFRLAEQYLIRAEAKAQQDRATEAIGDVNIIRERAGLQDLDPGLTKDQALTAIYQERRIEFFSEWGHRWLDLKRTNQIDAVLSVEKPGIWKSFLGLYPIPASEIVNDANLEQNPGY